MSNPLTGLPWDHPYWADRITPVEPDDPPMSLPDWEKESE